MMILPVCAMAVVEKHQAKKDRQEKAKAVFLNPLQEGSSKDYKHKKTKRLCLKLPPVYDSR